MTLDEHRRGPGFVRVPPRRGPSGRADLRIVVLVLALLGTVVSALLAAQKSRNAAEGARMERALRELSKKDMDAEARAYFREQLLADRRFSVDASGEVIASPEVIPFLAKAIEQSAHPSDPYAAVALAGFLDKPMTLADRGGMTFTVTRTDGGVRVVATHRFFTPELIDELRNRKSIPAEAPPSVPGDSPPP